MSRDEIEEELAVEFTPETLSVYADVLMAEGDPRGEVIAIDLRGGVGREAAIENWLGPLAQEADVEHGFITNVEIAKPQDLTRWFEHPAGKYLRDVRLAFEAKFMWAPLKMLVKHTARWVAQLSLVVERGMLNDADAAELLNLPRLERLEIDGERVLGNVGHPFVKALRITGSDAVGSLFGALPSLFPSVTSLDFAFANARFDVNKPFLERLPALRRLDLSRNEPGTVRPHNLGGHADPTRVLGLQPGRERISHLRMPSLRSRLAADQLLELTAGMPNLREVTIARAYRQFPTLILPPVVKQPEERWSWPPIDRAHDQIIVHVGHQDFHVWQLVHWLEAAYEDLERPARVAWQRLFSMLESDVTGPVDIPARMWRAALDTLDDTPSVARWRALSDANLLDLRVSVVAAG